MGYTAEQRQMLEAMGLRLYARIPVAAPQTPSPTQADDAFWHSRLGRNIQRMAPGRDLTALLGSRKDGNLLAKRMLWLQLRPLLKPE
jgi:hypothetical protein